MSHKELYALTTLVMSLANNPNIGSAAYTKELKIVGNWLKKERERNQ